MWDIERKFLPFPRISKQANKLTSWKNFTINDMPLRYKNYAGKSSKWSLNIAFKKEKLKLKLKKKEKYAKYIEIIKKIIKNLYFIKK